MRPNIYSYLDYRKYLSDMYDSLKRENRRFSKREFARIAGSPSPNYLQFIKERRLHMNREALESISEYLLLTRKEKRYFKSLVAFDHAKSHEEKDKHFRHIVSTREYGPYKKLHESHYSYLSHWYMPVIRELVTSRLYPGDPGWIAEQIIPPVSESKVVKGIKLLENIGLIYWSEDDERWFQKDDVLSTSSEVASVAVINYYKGILGLAKKSIQRFGPDERDMRGVTLGISKMRYREIKKQMESFWKQIMSIADEPQDIDRVYHVGLYMFPLSKSKDSE